MNDKAAADNGRAGFSDVLAVFLAAAGFIAGLLQWEPADDSMDIDAFFPMAGSILFFRLAWRFGGDSQVSSRAVIKAFVIATMFWAFAAALAGAYIAWQLAFPALYIDLPWLTFGRMRPLHTWAAVYGFAGNALLAASLHVLQRTCKTPLYARLAPWFVFTGFNTAMAMVCGGFVIGVTPGREFDRPEWHAPLSLTLVCVVYLAVFLGTLWHRRVRHIYIANWFFLACIVSFGLAYAVDSLAVLVSLLGPKSSTVYASVQDAFFQGRDGQNAMSFFLLSGFLGAVYFFVPERAGRPLYSYRLALLHFWALLFIFMLALHRHYLAWPDWIRWAGIGLALVAWALAWAGMLNGVITLSGAWNRWLTDPVLRFLTVPVVFYSVSIRGTPFAYMRAEMAIGAGPVPMDLGQAAVLFSGLAIWWHWRRNSGAPENRALEAVSLLVVLLLAAKAGLPPLTANSLAQYTQWGHEHLSAAAWAAMLAFGAVYSIVPKLYGRERVYSRVLAELHFWTCLAAILIYGGAMRVGNIMQELLFRSQDKSGILQYSFVETVEAMHPFYAIRAGAGALFLAGVLLMTVNLWMTARARPDKERPKSVAVSL